MTSYYNISSHTFSGKSFDITYVRLKFHTSRPESFAIYKRTTENGPWLPYQYYSGSCEKTYQKTNKGFIRTGEDEQQAVCTDEFSDISPLTAGNVAFSTLEGRPSAYNFDNSPVLQVNGVISCDASYFDFFVWSFSYQIKFTIHVVLHGIF